MKPTTELYRVLSRSVVIAIAIALVSYLTPVSWVWIPAARALAVGGVAVWAASQLDIRLMDSVETTPPQYAQAFGAFVAAFGVAAVLELSVRAGGSAAQPAPGPWEWATAAVLVPISHELLFRGVLQRQLHASFPGTSLLWAQALVYASCQLQPSRIVELTLVGYGAGVAMRSTGSLKAGIALQAAYGIATLLLATH